MMICGQTRLPLMRGSFKTLEHCTTEMTEQYQSKPRLTYK